MTLFFPDESPVATFSLLENQSFGQLEQLLTDILDSGTSTLQKTHSRVDHHYQRGNSKRIGKSKQEISTEIRRVKCGQKYHFFRTGRIFTGQYLTQYLTKLDETPTEYK